MSKAIRKAARRKLGKSGLFLALGICLTLGYLFHYMYQLRQNPPTDFSKRYNIHEDVRPLHKFGNKNKTNFHEESNDIPHIIHQTAIDVNLPNVLQPWMKSWLVMNPKWEYWFWTDEDIRKFIATRYPLFLKTFDSYQMGVARSDVFRYFVLYEFGGVYADTDIECLRPLDQATSEHSCILSQEPLLHAYFHYNMKKRIIANSFMACRNRHPFYKSLINQLQFYAGFENVIYATGPMLVDGIYDSYISQIPHFRGFSKDTELFVADPDDYQPKIDPRRKEIFARKCKRVLTDPYVKELMFLAQICTGLMSGSFDNGPKNNSLTIHHWTHMWKPKYQNDRIFGIKQKTGNFHINNLLA